MQQSITDFLSGLSKGFGNYIKEGMEKFRQELFFASVTILLTGIGFFLTLWGNCIHH